MTSDVPRQSTAIFSLKTRTALVAVVFVVLTALVVTASALLLVKRGMRNVIADQQAALLTRTADEIDQKFYARQAGLQYLASHIPPEIVANPASMQAYLEQHASLSTLFNNLIVFDAGGEMVANLNAPLARAGVKVAQRPYFVQTLATKKSVISPPLQSAFTGAPIVAITAPVLDQHGAVVLVIAGSIDLQKENFLGQLAQAKIGKTGYFYIVTADGTFVTHPIKSRILQSARPLLHASPALLQALTGFEGTIESSNSLGTKGLFSFKRLKATDWIIASVYPEAEAFAPIGAIEKNALLALLILIAVVGPLAWWITYHQIAPLQQLQQRIQQMRDDPEQVVPALPLNHRRDEIGALAQSFERLIGERRQVKQALLASKKRLRLIADNVPAQIGYIDKDERLEFANRRYLDLFSIAPGQLPGISLREVIGPVLYAQSEPYIRGALAGKAMHFVRLVEGAAGVRWDRVSYQPDLDRDGQVLGFFALAEDITELKKAQQISAKSEMRLRMIADNMPALIAYVDRRQRYRYCNVRYESLYGDIDQIVGHTVQEVLGDTAYVDVAPYIDRVLQGERVQFERFAAERGLNRHFLYDYIPDSTAEGEVIGFYLSALDITARKETERQLILLARYDGLTGIANRNQFNDRLPEAISRSARNRQLMAVMFLDIDHFKAINDTLGHHAGDLVLKEFARRLSATVRQTDSVSRLAGDEFVIILEGLGTVQQAELVAGKIIMAMAEPFVIDDVVRAVTTSIGIAVRQADETDPEALLRRADEALYRAKSAGRNTFRSATDADAAAV